MFTTSEGDDPDPEDNGIDEDDFIEITWVDRSNASNQPITKIQTISAQPGQATQTQKIKNPTQQPAPRTNKPTNVPRVTRSMIQNPNTQKDKPEITVRKPLRPNAIGPSVTTRAMLKSQGTTSTTGRTIGNEGQTMGKNQEQINATSLEGWEHVYDVSVISDPNEPKTIKQALRSPDGDKWKESALQELNNFYARDSWQIVDREEAYKMGKNIIGSKWVFKKKVEADGSIRYKSRIVSKGYMQIPGIDYTERFSPVATDTTTRMMIMYTLWKQESNWICETIDIEAAYLEGDIEEPTFMEWPPGMIELGQIDENTRRQRCI
jgi:hypothetical protein